MLSCHSCRAHHVCQLIYPLCTVLDDSIGCALWFGARGMGILFGQVEESLYLSQARVSVVASSC